MILTTPQCIRVAFAFTFLLLSLTLSAQYNGPESVEFDPDGDRYFVSNTGSQLINVREQDGGVSTFVSVGSPPYGLELMGDTLFACTDGGVKGYATADGVLVFDLDLNGTFVNGITTDGAYLYVTDFGAGRIYKVDVAQNTFTTLVPSTGTQPNGIVWDPVGERLVVVLWGGSVKSFDRESGAATTLVSNTGLASIDGITIDCLGNFLLASWSPDRITRYDPAFTTGVNTGITGLNNPADIDFDHVNNVVCIPNSGSNTVQLEEVDCTSGLQEGRSYITKILPNPTSGLVTFDPPFSATEPFMVLDTRGLLVAMGNLRPNAQLDLSNLSNGLYTILLTRSAQQFRVVKE